MSHLLTPREFIECLTPGAKRETLADIRQIADPGKRVVYAAFERVLDKAAARRAEPELQGQLFANWQKGGRS